AGDVDAMAVTAGRAPLGGRGIAVVGGGGRGAGALGGDGGEGGLLLGGEGILGNIQAAGRPGRRPPPCGAPPGPPPRPGRRAGGVRASVGAHDAFRISAAFAVASCKAVRLARCASVGFTLLWIASLGQSVAPGWEETLQLPVLVLPSRCAGRCSDASAVILA